MKKEKDGTALAVIIGIELLAGKAKLSAKDNQVDIDKKPHLFRGGETWGCHEREWT